MPTYFAFLRGMNLGNRRLTNAELQAHFEALGCAEVTTFRASGNVIFTAAEEDEEALAEQLEAGLGERLEYPVPVFLRSSEEVAAIAASEPFPPAALEASAGKLQVCFLREAPPAAARRAALALDSEEDRLAIAARELYWLPRGGISESELDLKALYTGLGDMTIRTMGTVAQLSARAPG